MQVPRLKFLALVVTDNHTKVVAWLHSVVQVVDMLRLILFPLRLALLSLFRLARMEVIIQRILVTLHIYKPRLVSMVMTGRVLVGELDQGQPQP
jgi:hypothetical protein